MANACYVKNAASNSPSYSADQAACSNITSGYTQCCNPSDACGLDGFCHFTHALSSPVTGYYLGGCTDPDFEDPACAQHCTSLPTQDVIFSPNNGLWSCCYGSGELDCRKPSNETFALPGPEMLFARTTSSSASTASTSSRLRTSASSSAEISTAVSNSPNAPSALPESSPESSDSSTTTIVIAVVVPVVVILATVAGLMFWRRRRRGRSNTSGHPGEDVRPGEVSREQAHRLDARHEMIAEREFKEMDSFPEPRELPAEAQK